MDIYLYYPSPFEQAIYEFVMPVDGTITRLVLSYSASIKPIYYQLYATPFDLSTFDVGPGDKTIIASGPFVPDTDVMTVDNEDINFHVTATTRISLLIGVNIELQPPLVEGVIQGGLFVIPD